MNRAPVPTAERALARLEAAALDSLMPLHVLVGRTGEILHVGRTLEKLLGSREVRGRQFGDVLTFRRPRNISTVSDLKQHSGHTLHVRLKTRPLQPMKALACDNSDGVLLNLSFGISIIEVLREQPLTIADFASTDLAMEMLYLAEANAAAMAEWRELTKRLEGARSAAETKAFTDTLTGLANRRGLRRVLERLRTSGTPFSLMLVDLDHFKSVNDRYGHAAGDHLLQEVARRLVEETRMQDTTVRTGGDEFVIVLEDLVDVAILHGLAERIIRRLEVPVRYGDNRLSVSASIGTAVSRLYESPNVERMMLDADAALYRSKRLGRARSSIAGASDT